MYPAVIYLSLLLDSQWWLAIANTGQSIRHSTRLSRDVETGRIDVRQRRSISALQEPLLLNTGNPGVSIKHLTQGSLSYSRTPSSSDVLSIYNPNEEEPEEDVEMGRRRSDGHVRVSVSSSYSRLSSGSYSGLSGSLDMLGGDPMEGIPRLLIGCVSIEEEIARGSYAKVLKGSYCGRPCAFKEFHCATLSSSTVPELIKREALAAWRLQHETVVEFFGFFVDPPKLYLAFEYCEQGSLFDILHKPRRHERGPVPISWETRVKMAWDAARAIEHCHSYDYCHRDIKSLNFLVGAALDGKDVVKLADFGESKESRDHMTARQAGTLHWMAPEVIRERGYSKASDVYSLSVVVWEILTQQEPYKGIPLHEVPMRVVAGMRPSIPSAIPNTLATAIRAGWNPEASKRPSASHIRLVLAATEVSPEGRCLAAAISNPLDGEEVARHLASRPDRSRLSREPSEDVGDVRSQMRGSIASEESRWLDEQHRARVSDPRARASDPRAETGGMKRTRSSNGLLTRDSRAPLRENLNLNQDGGGVVVQDNRRWT